MFSAPSVPDILTDDKRWEDFFFPLGVEDVGSWGKGRPLAF